MKPLSRLNSPAFVDQVSQAILKPALYNILTDNLQWFFDSAQLLDCKHFLDHIGTNDWLLGRGFTARRGNNGDLWEILCPHISHKMIVTAEYLTNFVATLPEGTKINIGGFKNV